MVDTEINNNNKSESGMQRDVPNLEPSVKRFVTKWQRKIRAAKHHFDDDFKRIREDMRIAKYGASKQWIKSESYTVPIINRTINNAVASLYAKNPTAQAKRRKTMDFKLWDGKPESVDAAMQNITMATQNGLEPSISDLQLLMDVEQGRQKRQMIDKVGRTLEILYDYFVNEQKPRLKKAMKAVVRRAKTCGIAYVMIGFQREYAELTPDDTAKIEDARNKLGELQRRMQDFVDGKIEESCESELYELEKLIEQVESSPPLLREGPVILFPKSTAIIVDPCCEKLSGFIGAGWIAREFYKTPDDIKKLYNVDVSKSFMGYSDNGNDKMVDYHDSYENYDSTVSDDNKREQKGMVCVWEVYNKDLGQTFTIADGYDGFLKECREPEYWMEGFWPIFALTFNDSESEEDLYPLSDVYQLRHVQDEYNRSREYRRLHRQANKPRYFVGKGLLEEEDLDKLSNAEAHAVIEVNVLTDGRKVEDVIQQFKPISLDPALYETNTEMEDVLRTVGAQEANLGGAAGITATEASIGEGSRVTGVSSNVDDLDEFLLDFVGAYGQLMLMELSKETVIEIVGEGAVWPELDREQIAKQLLLRVRAGSSGKPNKAAELANMERVLPYALQIPGINPMVLARHLFELLEIDLEDIIVDGMPSITALNAQFGRQTMGNSEFSGGNPNTQGEKGANNSPNPQSNEPGPQPGYPVPMI